MTFITDRILHTKYMLDSHRGWWHHAVCPLKTLEVYYLNHINWFNQLIWFRCWFVYPTRAFIFQCSWSLFLCLLVSCEKNVACSFHWRIVHIANLTSLLISCCREYGEAKLRRLSALTTISKFLVKLGFDLLKHMGHPTLQSILDLLV